MLVSIVLPSVFPGHLHATLDVIAAHTRSIDYEVIVVSPFEVNRPKVKWVREDQPRGNVPANVSAFPHAAGEFVLACADDAVLVPDWDAHCLANFQARERGQSLFCLGLNLSTRIVGTVFGIYYPYFPFARRSCFQTVGFYDEAYQAHFADADMALRIWSSGGRCEFSERPLIVHSEPDRDAARTRKSTALDADMATFLARWAPRHGAGWPTSGYLDFNHGINALTQLTFSSGNSIYFNDLKFLELYANYQANIGKCRAVLTFPD